MLHSNKLYIGITISKSFAISIWVLFILLIQSINIIQFLNSTTVFLSSNCFAVSLSSSPVIAIVPLTSMYAYH